MINRILEWHRIVNVQPSSQAIDQRTAAVKDLIKACDESSEWELVSGLVQGVIVGFEGGQPQNSATVSQIVSFIHSHDSAFPQDLADNALELRAAAATAIGEIIARNPEKPPEDSAILAALLVESGLGLRARPKERYLNLMLEELSAVAKRLLANAQQVRRRQVAEPAKKMLSFDESVADPLVLVKGLSTAVKSAVREFSQQAAIDREELNILWWLFAGASASAGKQLSAMAPGAAALSAGVEVAELCLLPPPNNADAFVIRAMEHVKKSEVKRPFDKIIDESDTAVRALLSPQGDASNFVERYPAMFSLSWLCRRLLDSNGATGWMAEYEAKTGLNATQSLDSAAVAVQAFRERIAQRQYISLSEG